MPVAMDWETPERKVIRITFMGTWDVNDLHRLITKRNSMMECVTHYVHQIYDMTGSTSSPSNLLSIMSRAELPSDKKGSLIVIISASDYIKSIANIMRTISPSLFDNVHFVSQVEAAEEVIERASQAVAG
ncbi:MAG: hypothetical protein LCI00_34105 [Chloroflexi bacterium]|nr:hypothetical protein [Chloroflexota bacterium]MCC6894450.1 hypothetical protein [Anaerolineae bacterium]